MANANTTSKKQTVNFTASQVRKFNCPDNKSEVYLWDAKVPGLGIRAKASGNRTYIYQGTVNGKTRRTRIGSVDNYDIEQARAQAKKLGVLASQNISPAKLKRQRAEAELAEEREITRGRITLFEVWDRYIQANVADWGNRHTDHHKKAAQEPGLPLKRGKGVTKAGCLYSIGGTKLADLDSHRIESWMKEESKTRPGVAAQTYRMLFSCLNWVSEQDDYTGLIDPSKLKTKSVKKSLPRLAPRTDVLQKEQLASFFKHVGLITNPVVSSYIQIVLLTGARRNELLGLKWGDVDFTWLTMEIRDKATTRGQEAGVRVIPLTPYIASLLNSLPRCNQYVFSSPRSASGRLEEPKKSFHKATSQAGLEITIHGLRRSFSTLSEWVEMPTGIVAQIMGHKPSATAEKHYKQRPIDLLRKWHTNLEAWILDQAGIEQPQNSLPQLTLVSGQ